MNSCNFFIYPLSYLRMDFLFVIFFTCTSNQRRDRYLVYRGKERKIVRYEGKVTFLFSKFCATVSTHAKREQKSNQRGTRCEWTNNTSNDAFRGVHRIDFLVYEMHDFTQPTLKYPITGVLLHRNLPFYFFAGSSY